ncbi:hypothetical protein [Catenulispora rubra]|uniref:hypothetical protein n=1 Tax=Catenulispora rubra TaxID=280293 RepID=UPI00189204B9|nr:hypothetical protein [Catenulispora rubra]
MAHPWMYEYIRAGFHGAISESDVRWFRIGLALAAILQWAFDLGDGGWHYLDRDRFVGFRYARVFTLLPRQERTYHVLYCLKLAAAILLLSGYFPQPASGMLALAWFFELSFNPANQTWLMLSAAVLSTFIGSGERGTFALDHATLRYEPFAVLLAVLLYWQMYWASAVRKLRSPEFMEGAVLHRMFEHAWRLQGTTRVRQSWYPRWFVSTMIEPDHEICKRRWRPFAAATVATEAAVPIGLAIPALWPYALLVGGLMHVIFVAYLPRKILPFTVATIAGYFLFAATLAV